MLSSTRASSKVISGKAFELFMYLQSICFCLLAIRRNKISVFVPRCSDKETIVMGLILPAFFSTDFHKTFRILLSLHAMDHDNGDHDQTLYARVISFYL